MLFVTRCDFCIAHPLPRDAAGARRLQGRGHDLPGAGQARRAPAALAAARQACALATGYAQRGRTAKEILLDAKVEVEISFTIRIMLFSWSLIL